MSSINEALRRSRREKTTPDPTLPAGRIPPLPVAARSRTPIIWATAVAVLLAAGAALYFGSAIPLKPQAEEPPAASSLPASSNPKKAGLSQTPAAETRASKLPDKVRPGLAAKRRTLPPALAETQPEAESPKSSLTAPIISVTGAQEGPAGAKKEMSTTDSKPRTIRYGSVRRARNEAQTETRTTPPTMPVKIPPVDPSKSEQAVLHFNKGQTAQNEGRYIEAVAEYHQALRIDPNLAQAYLNLGNIYFHHHQLVDKGQEMYNQVLTVDPDNKFGHNNLGVILLRRGLLDRAEAEFRAALRTDQGFVDALYNMACISARQGLEDQAMDNLRLAARGNPEVRRWAKDDWDLKSLRELPEFQAFIGQSIKNK